MHSEFDIICTTYGDILKKERFDIAILPWGATEPHNGHLPYGTDVLIARAIALDTCEAVSKEGINAMVLPGIPFGSQNPGQTGLPFCLHASQTTQAAILGDIVAALDRQGIKRLIILNGHGGNGFKGLIRDLAVAKPDFFIAVTDWFGFIPREGYFDADIDDHAGEAETSLVMNYYPELVKMEYAGSGASKPFAVEGFNKKVAWTPRNWAKVTDDTGVGDPSKSTPEKGRAYAEAVVREYVKLIVGICTGELYSK